MGKRDDNLFNSFRMTVEEAKAYNDLQDDLEQYGSNCGGVYPSPWIDYGVDEPLPEPSAIDAAMMCSGCPAVESCFIYAKVAKPLHGVFGGVKFRNGKEKWR